MRKLSRMRKDKAYKESFTNSLPVFLLVHQLLAHYRFVCNPRAEVLACLAASVPSSISIRHGPLNNPIRQKIPENILFCFPEMSREVFDSRPLSPPLTVP